MRTTQIRPKLFIYWETPPGSNTPPYIALCRTAIEYQCQDMDIRLITPENIDEYLHGVHPNLSRVARNISPDKVCLAIKTGFIRTFLLEKYGGVYTDIDSLPLVSLSNIWNQTLDKGFLAVRRVSAPRKHISIGLLAAQKDHPVLTEYANFLRKKLEQKYIFAWGEIGAWGLTPIVNRNENICNILHEKYAHPIIAEKQALFMAKDIELEDIIHPESITTMLFHKPFSGPSKAIPEYGIKAAENGWLNEWTVEDLYEGDILLSKIFRKSLPRKVYEEKFDYIMSITA